MRVVAIMPLKLDNERLPGKNTKLLGGVPLLCHQLNALLKVDGIDEIYVYCSSPSVEPLLPVGVKLLLRSKELDLPTSNFSQIFSTFSRVVDADIYLYDHATAPFVTVGTLQECLDAVRSGAYDSAFCAQKIQDFLWENGQALNFDATCVPRSQDLPVIYRETSGCYVFTKQAFLQTGRRVGNKPFIKELSFKEAVDINTPADFRLAEALLNLDWNG